MSEQQSRRSYFRIPVIIGVDYESAGPPLTARITNMSRGGMFVACTEPLEPETPISFTFHFPGIDSEDPVVGEGMTVWGKERHGMGVRFTRLSDSDQRRIQDFLEFFGETRTTHPPSAEVGSER